MAYNAAVLRMSDDPYDGLSHVGGLGFTFVAFALVFTGIGCVLEGWLHTGPWPMAAGVVRGGRHRICVCGACTSPDPIGAEMAAGTRGG